MKLKKIEAKIERQKIISSQNERQFTYKINLNGYMCAVCKKKITEEQKIVYLTIGTFVTGITVIGDFIVCHDCLVEKQYEIKQIVVGNEIKNAKKNLLKMG